MKFPLLTCLIATAAVAVAQDRSLTVDPHSPEAYPFEGWGTSVCWWGLQVGAWRDEALDPLIKAITDPVEGLGLTVFRYNVGGGDAPGHDHMRPHGAVLGYQPGPDAPVDANADPLQRRVLAKLVESSPGAVLEAFSNSPPHWMTRSGCASGSTDGGPNLPDGRIDDFTAYLAEVLAVLRDHHGLEFRTIDPFNEPDESWWKAQGTQEGCHFPESQQSAVVVSLRRALDARRLTATGVSATDAHDLDAALSSLRRFTPEALDALAQVNTHTYRGAKRRELRELAAAKGKRLWQSESGPMGLDARRRGLYLAMMERVTLDLNELRPAAWVMWQVVDGSSVWSCLGVDEKAQTFKPTPNFALYAQFTRQIRPGDHLVPTADPALVAAVNPAGQVTLVAVNRAEQARPYRVAIEGAHRAKATFSTVEAWSQEHRAEVSKEAGGATVLFEAPAESATTVVVERAG